MDILSSCPRYIAERSCFAQRLSKTVSASAENMLHWHSHSQNCHNRSHNCAICHPPGAWVPS
jgi:hypothetical protein